MEYVGLDLVELNKKFYIKRLDFNITYACNLACKGCISLSDFDRKGVEKLEDIVNHCKVWSRIIIPDVIVLFGGEPLLHPKLNDVILSIRQYWPKSCIRLITNGYLLKKYDPNIWFNYGPFEIQVSVHRKDHENLLNSEIKKILKCKKNWKIKQYKDQGHKMFEWFISEFRIYKSIFGKFVKPYKDNFSPFKSDPKKAHKICGSPNTPVLYKGKLYKCPPIANALDLKKDYTDYKAYSHTDDLKGFINSIGFPESVCAMCPENSNHSINHLLKENVNVKNID